MSKRLLTEKEADLVVFGYAREHGDLFRVIIPDSLIELMIIWFNDPCKILQFSRKYCSIDGFEYSKNNTKIKRVPTMDNGHKYIIAEMKPLFKGKHCFRAKVMSLNLNISLPIHSLNINIIWVYRHISHHQDGIGVHGVLASWMNLVIIHGDVIIV